MCQHALKRVVRGWARQYWAVLLLLPLPSCRESAVSSVNPASRTDSTATVGGSSSLRVVATTGMVADLVRHIGGTNVEVGQLMGEGVDPHLYKASTGDIAQLNAAAAIFYSGLHLEGKMADVFARLARKKPTFAVTDGISREHLLKVGPEQFDPHVWFDVSLWSECIDVVRDGLTQLDPAHDEEFRQNAEAYRVKLAELHVECKRRLAEIPAERRVLVTAHDAFHYFGRAYDVEVKAIQGVSTQDEAGVKQVNELVDFISHRGVKAVFIETSVNRRNIDALVEGCAARGHRVAVGGELFSDAMGQAGAPEGTYLGMVRHNVETITKALK